MQFLLFDLSCTSGGHSYRNYGKPTHSVTFAVFLRLQQCILYYSMCFCSLLYDALWLGQDALWLEQFTLWLEQFTLWLWLGQDALWPQQFTKSHHTPSCFLRNRLRQTQRPEVAMRHETTCMVTIRWDWSSWQTRHYSQSLRIR